ncbi:MAG: flagellar basal body-associated FliL family protein [Aquincola sp.]|nr:flagellar basal body-associated FliL family protein [Aquincola sp.]MDH4287566.1 flagellar basal body-associated FliL family protein [Aquincola sp.]MDH5331557.1 flagellar basal body-associated FliL family protein [Aquincola sp.]
MPAAAAAPQDEQAPDAAPVKLGLRAKKKLLVMIAGALLVLAAGGGGATWYVMKKRAAAAAAAAAEEGGDVADAHGDDKHDKAPRPDVKNAPTFAPLDPFTVNLADRDAERYAQVGMTLELADPKAGDLLKAYMPVIRNNILLVLASKTASELMEHDGKVRLALELRAAALKPLGYEIVLPKPGAAKRVPAAGDEEEGVPIRAVHFSNFIIQ